MRFRIRSLMILTAVVAVVCSLIPWLTTELVKVVALVAFLLIGPLIGSIWAGRRYNHAGNLDPLTGSVAGGLVQATVLSPLLALMLSSGGSGRFDLSTFLGALILGWFILVGIYSVIGVLVGPFCCLWFAFRVPGREEKRIEEKQG
jgi:hypothetical protein